jgi:hypothetical protein
MPAVVMKKFFREVESLLTHGCEIAISSIGN